MNNLRHNAEDEH